MTSKVLVMFQWMRVYYCSLNCMCTSFFMYELYHKKEVLKINFEAGRISFKDAEADSAC